MHDCQLIQDDLNNIVSFLDERQLKVAASKCKVLHFGKNNMKYTYFVGQTMLEAVEQIVDLGVTISTDLKSSKHCNAVVSKAAQRTNLIHIAFKTKTPEFLLPMCKTYVRPLLEYNCAVWNPHLMKDIRRVEGVQRRYTRHIPKLKTLTYEQHRSRLNIDTLELRRLKIILTEYYKIVTGASHIECNSIFTRTHCTYNLRRHRFHIDVSAVKTDARKMSFSYRFVQCWNSLPDEIFDADSIDSFKTSLENIDFSDY